MNVVWLYVLSYVLFTVLANTLLYVFTEWFEWFENEDCPSGLTVIISFFWPLTVTGYVIYFLMSSYIGMLKKTKPVVKETVKNAKIKVAARQIRITKQKSKPFYL